MAIKRSTLAVFLDKDGTLVHDVPYNIDPEKVALYPDAAVSLKKLQQAGYRLIVVSNQSGVARGIFTEPEVPAVFDRLCELLAEEGVALDDWRYCPHHPEGEIELYAVDCDCRKPGPGMILQAATDHGISLQDSWMIGDILHDVEAGNRAGCKTILLDNGHETEWEFTEYRTPYSRVQTLTQAVDVILAQQKEDLR